MNYLLRAAIVLSILVLADAALACGTPAEGRQLRGDLSRRLICESKNATGPAVDCGIFQAVCAEELGAFIAVLDGASTNRRCIRDLYREPRRYYARRTRELVRGKRKASHARRFIARIERSCEGESLNLGGPCAGVSDPREGGLCLRAVLERLAQNATGIEVPPNIVLALTDDQRWDTLGAMPLLREHVVDRGLEFTNGFTSTSLCCPDRASIFTGLYAHNHGVTSNAGAFAFDHDGDTIQRQLKENAGYKTALLGKYMVGTGAALGGTPAPGWDEWHVYFDDGVFGATHGLYYNYRLSTNGQVRRYAPLDGSGEPIRRHEYSTDLLRDRTVALIDTWSEEPFFLEYSPFAPHTWAVAADRHVGMFAGIPPHRPPSHREADLSGKPRWVIHQRGFIQLSGGQPGRTDVRRVEMLETLPAVDEAVAAISDALEAEGLTDNTLLIFTSDNGYMWLEHWLTLKNYPYEESIRVPLAIRYPLQIPAARQESQFVQPIDFYPTFAELAGITGAPVNGQSLVPLFQGNAGSWRQSILIEHFSPAAGVDTSHGIRTHEWKLIRTEAVSGVTVELYNMENDPFELNNVADEPGRAGVVASLSAQLDLLKLE